MQMQEIKNLREYWTDGEGSNVYSPQKMAPCRLILVLPELEKVLMSTGIADCRYFLGRVWTGEDGSWLFLRLLLLFSCLYLGVGI